jgi:hypothetical protein
LSQVTHYSAIFPPSRIDGMASVTEVPAEGGFAHTISIAPPSNGIQPCCRDSGPGPARC